MKRPTDNLQSKPPTGYKIELPVGNSETWKRNDGAHPKDYLFPLPIPSDTLYCTSN